MIDKGHNYGWGLASMGLEPGVFKQSAPGTDPPVTFYTPTIAPSGIGFYSGNRYPGWKNNLFVAALAGQELLRLEIKNRQVVAQEPVFKEFGRVRDVMTGPDGLSFHVLLQNPWLEKVRTAGAFGGHLGGGGLAGAGAMKVQE